VITALPSEVIVEVLGLKKHFPVFSGITRRQVASVKAVDGVSFKIRRGETFGLVGESGCGKTTTGRCILRLIEPTDGHVFFDGIDILRLDRKRLNEVRRNMQIVFQDPFSSLDPRMTVKNIIEEPLQVHGIGDKDEREKTVLDLIRKVELEPSHATRYPHELSGGQKQRVAIARALSLNPQFIVADEPVASLDVSIRAAVLNLMRRLQGELGLTYIFISHDLSVVRYICHRVAVMYLGKIVELADVDEIFQNPLHPYTRALLSAVPIPNPRIKPKRIILTGDVPSPLNPPQGCRFHPRCKERVSRCSLQEPEMTELDSGHFVSCHAVSSA
jgi:oligopeptide transport system ATP-binding protein